MLRAVICGFQVGSDIAGARAGKRLGKLTGGCMPAGFRTQAGSRPEYAAMYGAVALSSPHYPQRTRRNVRDSDATLAIGLSDWTPGERLTRRYCAELGRPYLWVQLSIRPVGIERMRWYVSDHDRGLAMAFLEQHQPAVLNVAGNANPAIETVVEEFLVEVLSV